jgi:hypothetical protein
MKSKRQNHPLLNSLYTDTWSGDRTCGLPFTQFIWWKTRKLGTELNQGLLNAWRYDWCFEGESPSIAITIDILLSLMVLKKMKHAFVYHPHMIGLLVADVTWRITSNTARQKHGMTITGHLYRSIKHLSSSGAATQLGSVPQPISGVGSSHAQPWEPSSTSEPADLRVQQLLKI